MFDRAAYEYDLPKHFIAQKPAAHRSDARLMVLPRAAGAPRHVTFADLPALLRPHDLLVLNDTKVTPARVYGKRRTGARVEMLFAEARGPAAWRVLTRCRAKLPVGDTILFPGTGISAEITEDLGRDGKVIALSEAGAADVLFETKGHAPLPPYIARREGELFAFDRERYQTVYAGARGAIAAPTAGLHFTEALFDELGRKGVNTTRLTLHVGEGTFLPVEADDIRNHVMHPERFAVPPATARALGECRAHGGRVIAVGTTVARALEAVWRAKGRFEAAEGVTDIFIHPPQKVESIDGLVTNFHLPGSTLLMLVAALCGRERILSAYEAAKAEGYRFYSYGDAMLVT